MCKDKEKLTAAYEGCFNANTFYIACCIDGKPVGITACSDNKSRALYLDKQKLKKNFGFIKGSFAYSTMKKEFHTPLDYPDNTAYIECVATIPEARGKGVATELMKYLLSSLPYSEYILEVTDTNTAARKIYDRMGFKVFEETSERFGKIKGFNKRIYMKMNTD